MKKLFAIIICILISFCSCNQKSKSYYEIYNNLDTLFSFLSQNYEFNGNILISKNGEIIFQEGYGYADFEKQKKLKSSTVFNLASISKQFTSCAISMLKEEGKLLFSDSLGKFFPKIPFKEITIKQLLNHTSGIPDYYTFMEKYWDKSKVANNNDILTILEKEQIELDFEPGQKYKYSNTGYVLLALIIENVTGEIYRDFYEK